MKADLPYRLQKVDRKYMLQKVHRKGRGCMGMKKEAKRIWVM